MTTTDPRYVAQVASLFATKTALPEGPSAWSATERDASADRIGEYHFRTPEHAAGTDILVGARASISGDAENAVIRVDVPNAKKARGAATLDLRSSPVPLFAVGQVRLRTFTRRVLADGATIALEIETLAADEPTLAFAQDPDFAALQ